MKKMMILVISVVTLITSSAMADWTYVGCNIWWGDSVFKIEPSQDTSAPGCKITGFCYEEIWSSMPGLYTHSYNQGQPCTVYRDGVPVLVVNASDGSQSFSDLDVIPGQSYTYTVGGFRGGMTSAVTAICTFIYTAEFDEQEFAFAADDNINTKKAVSFSLYKQTVDAKESISHDGVYYACSDDWIGAEKTMEGFNIWVVPNETDVSREGTVTISYNGFSWPIKVTQAPEEPPVEAPSYNLVAGMKSEVYIGLEGYAVKNLPGGLKYDAKKGMVSGTAKVSGEYEAVFSKDGAEDVTVVFSVHEEKVSVGCVGLSGGTFTAGVAGSADGIPLEIESETGVKSVSVTKLPAGMKYDTKTGLITGAPTKAGDYSVTVTVTTKSGAKRTETIAVSVAALPDNAVGTFNGFVKSADGDENAGTFQLAATDAGKLTAKVIMADGTYSFSGTSWDAVEGNVYSVTLTTKKGETLALALDSSAGWDANQLTGCFAAGTLDASPHQVVARRNAFGKTWYFAADGGIESGWTLSYAANAKAANLTVTLNADGSLKLAGKLGTLSVNAAGYADVTGIAKGVIFADFAPAVSLKEGKTTVKKVLSIRSNLWFDRSNGHAEGVGSAVLLR